MSSPEAITAESFPTPALALRSDDPSEEERVRGFATKQAVAAEQLRARLAVEWPRLDTLRARVALLRAAHDELVQWRYLEALAAPGRIGRGMPLNAERFRTSIRDGGINLDRIGDYGRLRIGATWNPASRRFEGGRPTPASDIMVAYGDAALARFKRERDDVFGDMLHNIVQLPHGRLRAGNRLLRGAAAARVAEDLVARIAARGVVPGAAGAGAGCGLAVHSARPGRGDRDAGRQTHLLLGTSGQNVDKPACWSARDVPLSEDMTIRNDERPAAPQAAGLFFEIYHALLRGSESSATMAGQSAGLHTRA